jgi:hypothetical protein
VVPEVTVVVPVAMTTTGATDRGGPKADDRVAGRYEVRAVTSSTCPLRGTSAGGTIDLAQGPHRRGLEEF